MFKIPIEVVQTILVDPTNLESVRTLVAPDATSQAGRRRADEGFEMSDSFTSSRLVCLQMHAEGAEQ